MTNQSTAQATPVQLQRSKFSSTRLKVRKPIKAEPLQYSNVSDFSPEVVKQQINMCCRELKSIIKSRATVSVIIDESGVYFTIIGKGYQCSIIYTEGGEV